MQRKSFCTEDTNNLEIIHKYSPMVYRLAYSMLKNKFDAEDVHQEVFTKYILKNPKFENAYHEKAWFLRVTINMCKNLWRSPWKQRVTENIEDYNLPSLSEPEHELIDTVNKLPQKYRIVIHLFYYEDLSIEEIATILSSRPSTIRTQLTRARTKLKDLLKEDYHV